MDFKLFVVLSIFLITFELEIEILNVMFRYLLSTACAKFTVAAY